VVNRVRPTSEHYCNMGSQVSKGRIQNQIDFWPNIYIWTQEIIVLSGHFSQKKA
jgi:hypothetical protein